MRSALLRFAGFKMMPTSEAFGMIALTISSHFPPKFFACPTNARFLRTHPE